MNSLRRLLKPPRFEEKIQASVFWQPKGSLYSKERKSNIKTLIFVAICDKIKDHFGILIIKTE